MAGRYLWLKESDSVNIHILQVYQLWLNNPDLLIFPTEKIAITFTDLQLTLEDGANAIADYFSDNNLDIDEIIEKVNRVTTGTGKAGGTGTSRGYGSSRGGVDVITRENFTQPSGSQLFMDEMNDYRAWKRLTVKSNNNGKRFSEIIKTRTGIAGSSGIIFGTGGGGKKIDFQSKIDMLPINKYLNVSKLKPNGAGAVTHDEPTPKTKLFYTKREPLLQLMSNNYDSYALAVSLLKDPKKYKKHLEDIFVKSGGDIHKRLGRKPTIYTQYEMLTSGSESDQESDQESEEPDSDSEVKIVTVGGIKPKVGFSNQNQTKIYIKDTARSDEEPEDSENEEPEDEDSGEDEESEEEEPEEDSDEEEEPEGSDSTEEEEPERVYSLGGGSDDEDDDYYN